MTKIEYTMHDGSIQEIEVSEEFAKAYVELEEHDKALHRKETRRHVSLDMLLERVENEGVLGCLDGSSNGEQELRFAIPNSDPLEILIKKEELENRPMVLELKSLRLTDYQFRIAEAVFVERKTQSQIAREFGISHQAINKQITKVKNKLQGLFGIK